MTAVGGFFFDSEPFRTASGVSSRSYWCKFEHGAGARPPELGAPRWKVGDASTPSPRSGTPRAAARASSGTEAAADRSGPRHCLRSARTASRGSERSAHTPSTRRVRRRAKPRWCCCRGMQACSLCGATGQTEQYHWEVASMRRPASTASVLVIDAARLARLLSAAVLALNCCWLQSNISFLSIQAKTRPTHAAWAASMRAESKTRRRRMALSCTHHSWLALLQP